MQQNSDEISKHIEGLDRAIYSLKELCQLLPCEEDRPDIDIKRFHEGQTHLFGIVNDLKKLYEQQSKDNHARFEEHEQDIQKCIEQRDKDRREYKEEINVLRAHYEETEKNYIELVPKVERWESEIKEKDAILESRSRQISDLRAELSKFKVQSEQQEIEIGRLTQENRDKEKLASARKQYCDSVSSDIQNIDKKNETLNRTIESKDAKITSLDKRISSLESLIRDLNGENISLTATNSGLKRELERRNTSLEEYKSVLTVEREKRQLAEVELEMCKVEKQSDEPAFGSLQHEVMQTELINTQNDLRTTKERLSGVVSELETFKRKEREDGTEDEKIQEEKEELERRLQSYDRIMETALKGIDMCDVLSDELIMASQNWTAVQKQVSKLTSLLSNK